MVDTGSWALSEHLWVENFQLQFQFHYPHQDRCHYQYHWRNQSSLAYPCPCLYFLVLAHPCSYCYDLGLGSPSRSRCRETLTPTAVSCCFRLDARERTRIPGTLSCTENKEETKAHRCRPEVTRRTTFKSANAHAQASSSGCTDQVAFRFTAPTMETVGSGLSAMLNVRYGWCSGGCSGGTAEEG